MTRTLKIILTAIATILVPLLVIFTGNLEWGGILFLAGLMIFGRVLVRTLPVLKTGREKWLLFGVSFVIFFSLLFIPCLFYYMFFFYVIGLILWLQSGFLVVFFFKGAHQHKNIILHSAFIIAFVSATIGAYLLQESGFERIVF